MFKIITIMTVVLMSSSAFADREYGGWGGEHHGGYGHHHGHHGGYGGGYGQSYYAPSYCQIWCMA